MTQNAYPVRATQAEVQSHHILLTGTGASAPTVTYGVGVTVTRTSEGLYNLTWADDPGTFIGANYMFGGSTPDDLQGHTAAFDDYASNAMEVLVQDSAFAVDDLEALEYLSLTVFFKRTAV